MTEDLKLIKPIAKINYWRWLFGSDIEIDWGSRVGRKNYRDLMFKSKNKLMKELDLRKFMHRQRVTMTSILGLLSGR